VAMFFWVVTRCIVERGGGGWGWGGGYQRFGSSFVTFFRVEVAFRDGFVGK